MHAFGLGGEVFLGVDHYFIGACSFGLPGLLFVAYSTDDACANHLRHLHEDESGAASGSMNQTGLTGFERKGGMGEVMRGHSLKHSSRRSLEIDCSRDLD